MYRQSDYYPLLKMRKVSIVMEDDCRRYKCIICGGILVQPRFGLCGCRYCLDCISSYLNGGARFCPGGKDRCRERDITISDVFPDYATDCDIGELEFQCNNENCQYRGMLTESTEHMAVCEYGHVQCDLCKQSILRKDSKHHKQNECLERLITCTFCGTDVVYRLLASEHHNVLSDKICEKFEAVCPYNCKHKSLAVPVKSHREICENKPRNCPLVDHGCTKINVTKAELNSHLIKHPYEHCELLMRDLRTTKQELRTTKQKLKRLEEEFRQFVWKIDNFHNSINNTENFVMESPIVGVGSFGYRYRLRLCIRDGDIGLYFILTRGEYDDMLVWPFSDDVAVTFVHPSDRTRSCRRTLCLTNVSEEDKMKYFKQPAATTDEINNLGYGWKPFIKLDYLQQEGFLTKSGCIFIRCLVLPAS